MRCYGWCRLCATAAMHVSVGRNDQHQRRRTATSAACRCPPQFAVRLLDRLEGDQFGSLPATFAIASSAVFRPLREPSRGLTSRRASYVVSCTTGTSRSRARSADTSLSAIPSPCRRRSSAGVTSTIPTRDFASPLSISRSNGEPRTTSFSLNQTETPSDSSRSCSSLAGPLRSSHAWQRKTSRRSGRSARFSTLSRTGVSARTSAGVYATAEPTRDHLGLPLLPDPPTLLRTPPRLLSNGGWDGTHSRRSPCSGHRMQGRPLLRSLS